MIAQKVSIATVGNVLDVNCWSGTAYYFYKAGLEQNLFNDPWNLDISKFRMKRYLWNFKQILLGRGKGGFQYSPEFLASAEAMLCQSVADTVIISFNQTFPRAESVLDKGGKVYYYIDTTLADLFREPSYNVSVPQWIKEKALIQEKLNYEKAEAIVTMGRWVHKSLIDEYGISSSKVHTILPGANIVVPEDYKKENTKPRVGIDSDFVIGFVGKDWKRKGLPILLEIQKILIDKGYRIIIKAMGCQDFHSESDDVQLVGFIDKQNKPELFLDFMNSCNIGCLFSSSEALGISTLEFLRLGIPVAGYYHQGLKDTLVEGASIRFDLCDSLNTIAETFERFIIDEHYQALLKENAKYYSTEMTWERSVREWSLLLNREDNIK